MDVAKAAMHSLGIRSALGLRVSPSAVSFQDTKETSVETSLATFGHKVNNAFTFSSTADGSLEHPIDLTLYAYKILVYDGTTPMIVSVPGKVASKEALETFLGTLLERRLTLPTFRGHPIFLFALMDHVAL
jgi:hypothetical protein